MTHPDHYRNFICADMTFNVAGRVAILCRCQLFMASENFLESFFGYKLEYTGCPKSSFLYFVSVYFSTPGLGKQIISTKVVSFNIIHYFHTCCAIF